MSQPDRSALQARNILLFMFVVLCILDTVLVIVAKDRWAIGRILLTILVMYFVIQGRKWAKYLLMSILSLSIVALVAMIVALGYRLSTFIVVGSWIMVAFCAVITVYMATNKDLNRYFSYSKL
jgi:hypothetical protein